MDTDAPALPDQVTRAFGAVADVLLTRDITFALVGGLATIKRGRIRTTKDVDLLLTIPQIQLPGLLDELIAQGFVCDPAATIRSWVQVGMVALNYGSVRVDWLKPVLPLYQHVLDTAPIESWQGRDIRIASAEGLILMKLIASRTQDVADIESILAANRSRLDLAWVEAEWLTVFPLDDPRWQRFRQAVGEYYETA